MSRPVPTSPEEAAQYAGELWDLHVKPGEEEGWTREQLAIQNAAAAFLPKLGLSAVLWQERDSGEVAGDLSVWHDGEFRPIATLSVVPAQRTEQAA